MTIHLWPALLSAAILLIGCLCIAAGLRIHLHSLRVEREIAEQVAEAEQAEPVEVQP